MNKDERSFEDRIVHFPTALADTSTGFDDGQIDDQASPAERLADELFVALPRLTPVLALATAKFMLHRKELMGGDASHSLGALDSLLQADTEQLLKQIIDRIFEAPKPRLSVGCLKMALGFAHADLVSQRHWAEKQGVCVEHVSNEVTAWQVLLGLPMTSAQKSAAAKENYHLKNQRKAA